MTHPTDSAPTQAPSEWRVYHWTPEERASMFIDWCALHGFGTSRWPADAPAQLAAHIRQALAAESERTRRECEAEIAAWKDTAEQHCRNQFFYHGIIEEIGTGFGEAARTSDDGSVQDSVLALCVPELVCNLRARAEKAEADLARAQQMLAEADSVIATSVVDPLATTREETLRTIALRDEALGRHVARRAKEETKGE